MRILRNLRYTAHKILLYEAILVGIAVAMSWLQGRVTIHTITTNWLYAGIVTIIVGTLSVYGAWGSTRSFKYQHSASITRSISERSDDHQRDMGEAFGFFGQAFVAGLVAILGSTILSLVI